MMIAEELDLPLDKVRVALADARPELLMNQLTGGSNSVRSIYTPVRTAAAIARQQLVRTAAAEVAGPGRGGDHEGRRADPRRAQRHLRLAREGRREHPDRAGGRDAQAGCRVPRPRHAAEPHRRARHRDRAQEVRHGPAGAGRQAVHGPPAADDQRHGAGRAQRRRGAGHAGRHRRRGDHLRRRGPRRHVRPVHRRAARAGRRLETRARWTASPTRPCAPSSRRRSCRSRCRRSARCRSTPSSRSRSPATRRWSRTTRSPTCAPTARRSGRR